MGNRGQRIRIAPGIYRDQYGLSSTVKVGTIQRERRVPEGTKLLAIRSWQDEVRAQLRKLPAEQSGTLQADVARYLEAIQPTLVSFADRRRHLEAWLPRFGHYRMDVLLSSATPALNAQLRKWRGGLSASSCNQRRDAITNLVKVLYGRRAALDLIDLVRFDRPDPVPRWLPREHVEAVLARLNPGTKTEVRLRLLHWTGMRPSQMGRLQLEDFRLEEPIPYVVVPRGKGGRLAAVPLVEEGLRAARDFIDRGAWSAWSCPSANKLLAAAAKKAAIEPFTVYQIRHSFSSALRRAGVDVADIQELYGHTDPRTTKIYAPAWLPRHLEAIGRLRTG